MHARTLVNGTYELTCIMCTRAHVRARYCLLLFLLLSAFFFLSPPLQSSATNSRAGSPSLSLSLSIAQLTTPNCSSSLKRPRIPSRASSPQPGANAPSLSNSDSSLAPAALDKPRERDELREWVKENKQWVERFVHGL